MKKKNIVIKEEFIPLLDVLSDADRGVIFKALMKYVWDNEKSELPEHLSDIFRTIIEKGGYQ